METEAISQGTMPILITKQTSEITFKHFKKFFLCVFKNFQKAKNAIWLRLSKE